MSDTTSYGILISDDLLDGSRVAGSARAAGVEVRQLRSAESALEMMSQQLPSCIIVDLHNPGLDVPALVAAAELRSPRPRIVAFGSHVDAARLRAARQAGCDQVMPRSQFFEELETRLPEWLQPPQPNG